MRFVLFLALAAALMGCAPGGSDGDNTAGTTLAPGELAQKRAATMKDDGIKPPTPPADSVGTPGGANR